MTKNEAFLNGGAVLLIALVLSGIVFALWNVNATNAAKSKLWLEKQAELNMACIEDGGVWLDSPAEGSYGTCVRDRR